MQHGKLVAEAAGWGRSVKSVQQMPAAQPRNTEHYSSAILQTPAGEPVNALPSAQVLAEIGAGADAGRSQT